MSIRTIRSQHPHPCGYRHNIRTIRSQHPHGCGFEGRSLIPGRG